MNNTDNTILNIAEGALHNITAAFNRPVNMHFLTLDNPVFGTFMFWTSLLALKMFLMSILTAFQMFKSKGESDEPNQNVERIRSAHRNDMENILPYFTIGLLYVCINPPPLLATILFRLATIFRFCHTIVYAIYPVPQPARLIFFGLHYLISIYMTIHVMVISILWM